MKKHLLNKGDVTHKRFSLFLKSIFLLAIFFQSVSFTLSGQTSLTLNCPADLDHLPKNFYRSIMTDSLTATDPSTEINSCLSFGPSDFEPEQGAHYYDTLSFTVSETTVYSIIVAARWGEAGFALFRNELPAQTYNWCQLIYGQYQLADTITDAHLNYNSATRFDVPLVAGEQYVLLITGKQAADTGPWSAAIYAPDANLVSSAAIETEEAVELNLPLLCEDAAAFQIEEEATYSYDADSGQIQAISADLQAVLMQTGYPEITDYCGMLTISVSDELESAPCGTTLINRTFRVQEEQAAACGEAVPEQVCTQTITFNRPSTADLILPLQAIGFSCDENLQTDGEIGGPDDNPSVDHTTQAYLLSATGFHALDSISYCGLRASYTDWPRLNICDDAYKYRRNWHIIDDCDSTASFIWEQYLRISDFKQPQLMVAEFGGPNAICTDLVTGQFGDAYGICEVLVDIPFSLSDNCTATDSIIANMEIYMSEFVVDENQDGVIDIYEFFNDQIYELTDVVEQDGDGQYRLDFRAPIITNEMGAHTYHAIRIETYDNCGNSIREIIMFDAIDCKRPTPVAINGLQVNLETQLNGECSQILHARDLEAVPTYDCTGQGPEVEVGTSWLRVNHLAVYKQDDIDDVYTHIPSPADSLITITWDDASNDGVFIIYLYAIDNEGNFDYAETYINVVLTPDCGATSSMVVGEVTTELNQAMPNVSVEAASGIQTITDQDGHYSFDLALNETYSINPYWNDDHPNGISTLDFMAVYDHVLGTELLSTPYKMIAADVDGSNSITTVDMIQIQKIILGTIDEFPSNTSWQFIDKDYEFPASLNPWQSFYPSTVYIPSLTTNGGVANFIGVKTGDVDNSAELGLLSVEDRSLDGQFNFYTAERILTKGQHYSIPFRGRDMASIKGYQATLALEGAELLSIDYGLAQAENFGWRFIDQGMLTTSWAGNATDDELLFTLNIKATAHTKLSDVLRINSIHTKAEAYTETAIRAVAIDFVTDEHPLVLELYQNQPNPFNTSTKIAFNLPANDQVSIRISDAYGRILKQLDMSATQGYNSITIDKKELGINTSAMLTYSLHTSRGQVTKTMLVVD